MGLGTLAHTVGKLPLAELTKRLGQHDIDFVQLALTKAISDIDCSPGKLSPGLANHIAEQFAREQVRIGVLGCYIDPIHPDPDIRRNEVKRFKEHIRFARDFGTSIVATETGDPDPCLRPNDERRRTAWNTLKSTVEELVDEAERWGVFVGIEPVCVHTIATPEYMSQLLEEIPSSHLGVVFDPVNLLDQCNFADRDDFLARAVSSLSDRIVLTHLKDVRYSASGRLPVVPPGQGELNIPKLLNHIRAYKPCIDISVEGLDETNIDDGMRYLRSLSSGNT